MPRTGIALGSNLGERLTNLRAALDRLRAIARKDSHILIAPVYQTSPVGCPGGSPDFYNTVVEISCDGGALELLEQTQAIEAELGRDPDTGRNSPRIIDVDLLYFGDIRLSTETLELPHPRLTMRRFVLQPLADIRPDLVLPGDHSNIAWHLRQLPLDEEVMILVQTGWERRRKP